MLTSSTVHLDVLTDCCYLLCWRVVVRLLFIFHAINDNYLLIFSNFSYGIFCFAYLFLLSDNQRVNGYVSLCSAQVEILCHVHVTCMSQLWSYCCCPGAFLKVKLLHRSMLWFYLQIGWRSDFSWCWSSCLWLFCPGAVYCYQRLWFTGTCVSHRLLYGWRQPGVEELMLF